MNKLFSLLLLLSMAHWGYTQQTIQFGDSIGSQIPVTSLTLADESTKIQFAIVPDRTGGMVPGIYEQAIANLAKLKPQFAISIGDMINGYTDDQHLIDEQWEEFNAILANLPFPFFYLPGNHDITNPLLQQNWDRRYGSSYYHFRYKDVLFLCLNTEENGQLGLSDKQVSYFQDVLSRHQDVRWTFVFLHRPLWNYDNLLGFEHIEEFLSDRQYTVFAGHHHNYQFQKRHGRSYIMLATSGGGSGMRGAKFGEFHHITWLTLDTGEPDIVNIALSGFVPKDVVNDVNLPLVQTLRSGLWMTPHHQVVGSQIADSLVLDVSFSNLLNIPMAISGVIQGDDSLAMTALPNLSDLVLAPQSDTTIHFLLFPQHLLTEAPLLHANFSAAYRIDTVHYSLPTSKRFFVDWAKTVQQEGDIPDWITVKHPEYITEAWDWYGVDDSHFKFSLAQQHSDSLIIRASIYDDLWLAQDGEICDKLFVYLQDVNGRVRQIDVTPEIPQGEPLRIRQDGSSSSLQARLISSVRTHNQWNLKLMVPLAELNTDNGMLRFNLGFRDYDDLRSNEYTTAYWKPLWNSREDYDGSGMVLLRYTDN